MKRRLLALAALALAVGSLPGCAISLFSNHDASDAARMEQLERRMNRIEEHLPK